MIEQGPTLSERPGRRENFPAPDVEYFGESEPLRLLDERENWLQLGDLVIEGLGRVRGNVEYRPVRPQDLEDGPAVAPAGTEDAAPQRAERVGGSLRRGRVGLGSRVDPNLAPAAPRVWSRPVVRLRRGSTDE